MCVVITHSAHVHGPCIYTTHGPCIHAPCIHNTHGVCIHNTPCIHTPRVCCVLHFVFRSSDCGNQRTLQFVQTGPDFLSPLLYYSSNIAVDHWCGDTSPCSYVCIDTSLRSSSYIHMCRYEPGSMYIYSSCSNIYVNRSLKFNKDNIILIYV